MQLWGCKQLLPQRQLLLNCCVSHSTWSQQQSHTYPLPWNVGNTRLASVCSTSNLSAQQRFVSKASFECRNPRQKRNKRKACCFCNERLEQHGFRHLWSLPAESRRGSQEKTPRGRIHWASSTGIQIQSGQKGQPLLLKILDVPSSQRQSAVTRHSKGAEKQDSKILRPLQRESKLYHHIPEHLL